MPYRDDPEAKRAFLEALHRVAQCVFPEADIRHDESSVQVRFGAIMMGPDRPGADYRAVINNDRARVELLVQCGGIDRVETHRDILRSHLGVTATWVFAETNGASMLRIQSTEPSSEEGLPLMVFCLEHLFALDKLFRPYVLKHWRRP